jgi:hypothetical protein
MALTTFELRRAALIARTFIPKGVLAGTTDDLDAAALLREDDTHSPWHASLLLRGAVWLVWLSPLWTFTGLRTFGGLAEEARADLLGRLLHHDAYPVRQAVMYLKLCACNVLLGSERVLAHLGAYRLGKPAPQAANAAAAQPPAAAAQEVRS